MGGGETMSGGGWEVREGRGGSRGVLSIYRIIPPVCDIINRDPGNWNIELLISFDILSISSKT